MRASSRCRWFINLRQAVNDGFPWPRQLHPARVPPIDQVVYQALAHQLQIPVARLQQQAQDDLGALGLDSHGLMQVLLEIERQLELTSSLELDDAALATPESMLAGVRTLLGTR